MRRYLTTLLVLAPLSVPIAAAFARDGALRVLPADVPAPYRMSLAEEAALVQAGLVGAQQAGAIPAGEGAEAADALATAYAELAGDLTLASPVPAGLAGANTPAAFEAQIFRPAAFDTAVVFLHGYGGPFTWPCAELAASAPDALVVCPSLDTDAHWWTSDGEAIAREAVAYAHAQGATRVVLAGLSNGGIGATRLAPRLRGELDGVVAISGADAAAAPPGVPVLVVHARGDGMASYANAARYAANTKGELLTLTGDHFAWVARRAQTRPVIGAFVSGPTP